jgi:hypothetical protein
MPETRVVVVHLRRPRLSNPKEMRSDPFWEFGSFGLTGCHSKNLMNPKKSSELNGVRFAFAQGGNLGMRLVHLSPPVKITPHGSLCEATWQPNEMPFNYSAAPLLISKDGQTSFPLLKRFLKETKRGGWLGRFSSRFRSRRRPLEMELSEQLVRVYQNQRKSAPPSAFSRFYIGALPYPPPTVDRDRESTYSGLLAAAREPDIERFKPKRSRCR